MRLRSRQVAPYATPAVPPAGQHMRTPAHQAPLQTKVILAPHGMAYGDAAARTNSLSLHAAALRMIV